MVVDINQYNAAKKTEGVLCKCDVCGEDRFVEKRHVFKYKKCKSCALKTSDVRRRNTESKLIGRRYDKLVVIKRVFLDRKYNKGAVFECKCDCGNVVTRAYQHLASDKWVKSCGCYYLMPQGEAGLKRLFKQYKRNADLRNYPFELTIDQFKELTSSDCYYCGTPPSRIQVRSDNGKYIYNGVDRVKNDIGYVIDNCVPCCSRCNTGKWDNDMDEFESWVKKVHAHRFELKTIKMEDFVFS